MARVFLSSGTDAGVAALRDTTIAFAPGLVGYGLVAVLTRALYARGMWKAPTVCVVGGWLVAVVADVVLAGALPAADRALALGAGHTLGRHRRRARAARRGRPRDGARGPLAGLPRIGTAALAAAAAGAAAGLAAVAGRWAPTRCPDQGRPRRPSASACSPERSCSWSSWPS